MERQTKTLAAGIVIGLVAGAACFGLGLWAARGSATPAVPAAPDAGVGPRVVIDPDSIQLLPDAALRLDLPAPLDASF